MKNLIFPFIGLLLLAGCSGAESSDSTQDEDHIEVSNDSLATDTLATNESAEMGTLTDIRVMSQELPKEVSSLDTLHAKITSWQSNLDQPAKDSAFHYYVKLMQQIANKVGDIEMIEESRYEYLRDTYVPYGFNIQGSEGYTWLTIDQSVAVKPFKDIVSEDLLRYAKLDEITAQQYAADGGMMVGYEAWGKVVMDLEDRMRKNKNSKYYSEFKGTYKAFLQNFMYGMDNTPITTWEEPKQLTEETKAAYEMVIADKQHKTGNIIKEHMLRLEANNYEWDWDRMWQLSDKELKKYLEL